MCTQHPVLWSLPGEPALMPVPMQATADAIFGGCGYVPDVSSLQAWLECAWTAGYDPMGAEQLGGYTLLE